MEARTSKKQVKILNVCYFSPAPAPAAEASSY